MSYYATRCLLSGYHVSSYGYHTSIAVTTDKYYKLYEDLHVSIIRYRSNCHVSVDCTEIVMLILSFLLVIQ